MQDRICRKPVGIIDIGSNTVRLVVYDGIHRTPMALFNEKATCALGTGIESRGRLNPDGVPMAAASIERFVHLARAMNVERLDILATAACRDASDGRKFLKNIEKRTGVPVTLLSGEEEAIRAAYGVLCSIPDADGMVADLGGGSLELVTVTPDSKPDTGEFISLALGVLRLAENAGNSCGNKLRNLIRKRLAAVTFLEHGKGRHLYAVGGSWRALAQIIIEHMDYPLHVLDNFSLPYDTAREMVSLVTQQNKRALEKMGHVSKRRLPYLPLAAALLDILLEEIQPDALVFSVYGMREGQFFLNLPQKMQDGDPLLSAATEWARAAGRFPEHGRELLEWMAPLFPDEPKHLNRLRHAACLLGDIFWSEHPDYRAEQAFLKVLRLPFMGLNHTDRAALALAVYYRYSSSDALPAVKQAQELLDAKRLKRVRLIGAALRLGHSISGGAAGILAQTQLEKGKKNLVLAVPADDPVYYTELFGKKLDKLANELGCKGQVIQI